MIGAAVVIVLVGLVVPISMLLAAVVFDLCVLAWVMFSVAHDEWWPRLTGSASGLASRSRSAPRLHPRPQHAH